MYDKKGAYNFSYHHHYYYISEFNSFHSLESQRRLWGLTC